MDVVNVEEQRPGPLLNDYADYRRYLKDYYQYKKTSDRRYNYGVFSARADIKSPNYLKLVIEGKRNLSDKMAEKFARAMEMDKEQSREFLTMVKYCQAKRNDERNLYLRELAELRVKKKIAKGEIKQEVWENIPSWVSWVIYEMADMEGVNLNDKNLAQLLRGNVRQQDVENAIEKLIQAGELKRNDIDGRLEKASDVTRNREDVPVALVKKLQSELIQIGMDSLYHDSAEEREFGALTLCLTEEEFEKLKFELRQIRKRIHRDTAVARKENKGKRIYQLNLQLFPLTN
tara:strand:+ start:10811 stop:11677 length:867 start_codon:yes stop_codon:yes gene_type:complete